MEDEVREEAVDIVQKTFGFVPYDIFNWVFEKLEDGWTRSQVESCLDPTTSLADEIN